MEVSVMKQLNNWTQQLRLRRRGYGDAATATHCHWKMRPGGGGRCSWRVHPVGEVLESQSSWGLKLTIAIIDHDR